MYIIINFTRLLCMLLSEEGLWEKSKKLFLTIVSRFNELFSERFCRDLLMSPAVRAVVQYARAIYFIEVKQQLRTFDLETGGIAKGTIEHNLKGLDGISRLELHDRNLKLTRPLSVVQTVSPDSRILVIGPRTEDDLLALVGHGFKPENIRGLDIISYSPWVDLGDMHAMNYPDNTWDVVLAGWVIPYSKEPQRFMKEMVRVVKPGGLIGIGFEYSPSARLQSIEDSKWEGSRMNSLKELYDSFGASVEHVFFSHDISSTQPERMSELVTIFSVRK